MYFKITTPWPLDVLKGTAKVCLPKSEAEKFCRLVTPTHSVGGGFSDGAEETQHPDPLHPSNYVRSCSSPLLSFSIYHPQKKWYLEMPLSDTEVFSHQGAIISTVLTQARLWAIILGTFSTPESKGSCITLY